MIEYNSIFEKIIHCDIYRYIYLYILIKFNLTKYNILHEAIRSREANKPRGRKAKKLCKRNVFMTGSERVHVGSFFAGKMTPEAILHS